jgi:hypothetical protein
MSARVFPFWIITQPARIPPVYSVSAVDGTRRVAAFSSQESAIALLHGLAGDWEFKLVCRATLEALVGELRRFDIQGVCFEPDSKGQGDTASFDELERFLPAAPQQPEVAYRVISA